MELNSLHGFQLAAEVNTRYPDKGSNLYGPILGSVVQTGKLADVLLSIEENDGAVTGINQEIAKDILGELLMNIALVAGELDVELKDVATQVIEKHADANQAVKGAGDET